MFAPCFLVDSGPLLLRVPFPYGGEFIALTVCAGGDIVRENISKAYICKNKVFRSLRVIVEVVLPLFRL